MEVNSYKIVALMHHFIALKSPKNVWRSALPGPTKALPQTTKQLGRRKWGMKASRHIFGIIIVLITVDVQASLI